MASTASQMKATKGSKSGGKQAPDGQRKISSFFASKPSTGKDTPPVVKPKPDAALENRTDVEQVPTEQQTGVADDQIPKVDAAKAGKSESLVDRQTEPDSKPKPGKDLEGKKVRVYWPDDKKWYKGEITEFDAKENKHFVCYDDGDEEWLFLPSEKYELLGLGSPAKRASKPAGGKAAKAEPNKKETPSKGSKKASRSKAIEDLEDDDVEMDEARDVVKPSPRKRLVKAASQTGNSANTVTRKGKGAAKPPVRQEEDVSDSEDELEDSGSEFEAGNESDSDGNSSEDLVAEESESGEDDDNKSDESDDDVVKPAGTKRKRATASKKGAIKKATPSKKATTTPAAKRTKTVAADTPTTDTAPKTAAKTPATTASARTPATLSAAPRTPATAATPLSAEARRQLHQSLDITPATNKTQGPVKDCVHGIDTKLNNEDAGRFLARMAEKFPFLHPKNLKDADQRRPDHLDYDPSTLYIPPGWFKEKKISEGQQQWWGFKARHFDSVLLFKMGKFYEMFEMDAYVGVDVLGLSFMKGEQPHAGFPEIRYHDMAEALARAGYRVVVVEQTETPEQLAKRNEERKRAGQKQQNVVMREKVAVLSKGTLIDAEMVASKPDPSYVMAVAELPVETCGSSPADQERKSLVTRLGVAAVDVASGHLVLGEFLDDEVRSSLRTHLTTYQPVELVVPSKPCTTQPGDSQQHARGSPIDPTTMRVLKASLREPRINHGRHGVWSAQGALQLIQDRRYFSTKAKAREADQAEGDVNMDDSNSDDTNQGFAGWPPVLKSLARAWTDTHCRGTSQASATQASQSQDDGGAALAALCGLLQFLKDSLLDMAVVPQGRLEILPTLQRAASSSGNANAGESQDAAVGSDEPVSMLMNGSALENLEILENTEGGSSGSLLSVVDQCVTPFGRRRLRQWLCRPLYRTADIIHRQDAVAFLMEGGAEAAGTARKALAGVSDLERAVARLFASTVAGAAGRDAVHVVLYEDAAKRKVKALTTAIRDLQNVTKAANALREALDQEQSQSSSLMQRLTDSEKWGRVQSCLSTLNAATDWSQAEATGRVVPSEGVDEQYDEALEGIREAEDALKEYLQEVKKMIRGTQPRDVTYTSLNKETHVIETPDKAEVPKDFLMVGQKKGFKRWATPRLRQLAADLAEAEAKKEAALANILQGIVIKFCDERQLWSWAVDSVANLDALMSLAGHALGSDGPMCRPVILPNSTTHPVLQAKGLRHPAGLPGRCGTFVPNDISLGGSSKEDDDTTTSSTSPSFILLSGPNMGGKSTLLRQACLAAVLAQVGACVPADSMHLTPVDAVFVRMGAKDHIMTGQSTFFVELAETAAMLRKATSRSLVALDELGRGTATLDGAAIAWAVLQHMVHVVGCRGLFATHYHHLSKEYKDDPLVAVMHMACAVGNTTEEDMAGQDAEQDTLLDQDTAMKVDQPDQAEVPEVTFLYKLTPGACPKSYGTNVARLAGIPAHIVQRAACISASTEIQVKAATAGLTGDIPKSADAMDLDSTRSPDGPSLVDAAIDTVALLKQTLQQQQPPVDENHLLQKLLAVQAKAKAVLNQETGSIPMEVA